MHIEILDMESIEQIHQASLTVLEKVGLVVKDHNVCSLLKEGGAEVDKQEQVVKMPKELVLGALESVPHEVRLFDHHGEGFLLAEGERPYHFSSDFQSVMDFRTSRVRRTNLQDIAEIARLGDFLPAMKGICHQCLAEDVPEELSDLLSIEAAVLNTTKHCLGAPIHIREAEIWTEVAEIILGEDSDLSQTPIISFAISTTSPLQFDQESVNVLVYAARRCIPIITIPCPMAGATTPFTLAGTLVVQNAENLFSITLSQLVNERAPVVYGGIAGIMDMRTGCGLWGVPEFSLMSNAVAQLAKFYGLPSYSALGDTDALEVDVQSGAEKMLSYLTGFASGLNLSVAGGIGMGTAISSYEQLVIDNDIVEIVDRYMQGIRVDQDTLALEVIEKVGPGGNYLMEDHTLTWLRRGEHYYPQVFNRQARREGLETRSVFAKAHERAVKILAEHKSRVPEEVSEWIRSYVRDKTKELSAT